jgi:hydrogenase maturation factor
MTAVLGTIREVYLEQGVAKARVHASGTTLRVPLTLMMEARVGDEILVDSGIAIGHAHATTREGTAYVSGYSGESADD